MYRVDKGSKSLNNPLSVKARIVSDHKNQLLIIMASFFARTMTREDSITALSNLQVSLAKTA
jgi:hypothetical protein